MRMRFSRRTLLNEVGRLERETVRLSQNETRLEALLRMNELSGVGEADVMEFAFDSMVAITGSEAGYLHFVNEDAQTIGLVYWSSAVLASCDAKMSNHYPIEKAGIWADSIRLRRPVVHNDFRNEPGRRGYPEGHFDLIRHLSVPVFDEGKIVAVAGVGNKAVDYDDSDVTQLSLFMSSMWVIMKKKRTEAQLERCASEDWLTGLANRRTFDETMVAEVHRARRARERLSAVILDIDRFKAYNDEFGHQRGDDCLRQVAWAIRKHAQRAGDLVARYGGEEFAVILPRTEETAAHRITESMRASVRDLVILHPASDGRGIVTISAGVATIVPTAEDDDARIVKMADAALYLAKEQGRDRACLASVSVVRSGAR